MDRGTSEHPVLSFLELEAHHRGASWLRNNMSEKDRDTFRSLLKVILRDKTLARTSILTEASMTPQLYPLFLFR